VSRIRTTIRLFLVFSVIVAALASSQAAAQRPGTSTTTDDTAYESELTGLEFTWTDDWELASSDAGADDELIQLDSDLGFVRTGFAISEEDAEWGRDEVLSDMSADVETFEVIDEDSNRDLSWSLVALEETPGEPLIVYVEVVEDFSEDYELLTLIAAGEADFVEFYELAYDSIEIDGDPLLDQFDPADIEEILASGATVAEDEASPPASGNESETGLAGDDEASGSSSDTYVFETAEIEVVVGEDVQIDETQVEEGSYEQILLVGVGSIGAVSLVQSPSDAESTLEGFMDGFMAEMDDSRTLETGLDGGVAWGFYEASVGGRDMYVYARVSDDQFDGHYLELIAAPADFFEDEFVAYQDSVEINGASMFEGIDVDDLLAIIDAS
jgi:hypothetical protein